MYSCCGEKWLDTSTPKTMNSNKSCFKCSEKDVTTIIIILQGHKSEKAALSHS